MSTFTDWNGPQGSNGPANSDWRELVQMYKDAITALGNKQDKLTFDETPVALSDNPVKSRGIHSAISGLQTSINAINNALGNYIERSAADSKYQSKGDYATSNDVDTKITNAIANLRMSNYIEKAGLDKEAVITGIREDISRISAFLEDSDQKPLETFEMKNLKATEYITGIVNAIHEINLKDSSFKAYIGGSNDIGVFYVLGMVNSDKGGTAYIKYTNTSPFAAVIDFAVRQTGDYSGALGVLTDADIPGLKFLLVKGTTSVPGDIPHVYLAVQATEWVSQFASTDGVGKFPYIDFEASGINFAPIGSKDYIPYNAECHAIAVCDANFGYNASSVHVSSINTDSLTDTDGDTIFNVTRANGKKALVLGDKGESILFAKRPERTSKTVDPTTGEETIETSPYVTAKDINSIAFPVGGIIRWQVYDEVKETVTDEDGKEVSITTYVLKHVPECYHACDGSDFDIATFPELTILYPDGKLPKEDFSIIKMTDGISGDASDDEEAGSEYTPTVLSLKRLESKIDNEIIRAAGKDTEHSTSISDNATAIQQNLAAIQNLVTALDNEIARSTGKDTEHSTSISDNATAIQQNLTAIQNLVTALDNEITRSTEKDTEHDTSIANEIARSTEKDTEHDTSITSLDSLIKQVNKQALQIFTGTPDTLPTVSPTADGRTIVDGQKVLLNNAGTLTVYAASVDSDGNIIWTEA